MSLWNWRAVAIVTCPILLAVAFLTLRESPATGEERAQELSKRGLLRLHGHLKSTGQLEHRRTDPANLAKDHFSLDGEDEERLAALADTSENALAAFSAGDLEWSATVLELQDYAFVADARLECAAQHAGAIRGACPMNIDVVARRDPLDSTRGKIVYSRGELLPEDESSGDLSDPSCSKYVRCLAAARLDQDIPLPAGGGDEIPVRSSIVASWADPAMFDPAKVAKLIELHRESAAGWGETAYSDPYAKHSQEAAERLVDYLESHLERLKEMQ